MQWSTSTNRFQFSFTGQVRLTPDTSHCWEANHWERPSQIRLRNEWKNNFVKYTQLATIKILFLCQWNMYSRLRASKLFDVLHGLLWFIAKSHFHAFPLCSPFDTCFLSKLLINEGKPQTVILGRYFVEGSALNISWGPMCSLFLPFDENFEGKSCILRSKYLKLEYFIRTDVFSLACHFE